MVNGGGLIRPLPFLRTVLVLTALVLLARGLVLFAPDLLRRPDLSPTFITLSSLIVLAPGLLILAGLWTRWNQLGA
jgi:uncharacterized membrane protein YoaT (DUF817 family)